MEVRHSQEIKWKDRLIPSCVEKYQRFADSSPSINIRRQGRVSLYLFSLLLSPSLPPAFRLFPSAALSLSFSPSSTPPPSSAPSLSPPLSLSLTPLPPYLSNSLRPLRPFSACVLFTTASSRPTGWFRVWSVGAPQLAPAKECDGWGLTPGPLNVKFMTTEFRHHSNGGPACRVPRLPQHPACGSKGPGEGHWRGRLHSSTGRATEGTAHSRQTNKGVAHWRPSEGIYRPMEKRSPIKGDPMNMWPIDGRVNWGGGPLYG